MSSNSSKTNKKSNIFEASFTNLDLSEFDTGATTRNTSVNSASAQLLQVKEREKIALKNELEEEEYMQCKAKMKQELELKRFREREEEEERKKNGQSAVGENKMNHGLNWYGAVMSMHSNDKNGKQLEKAGLKTKAQKRMLDLNKKVQLSSSSKKIKQQKGNKNQVIKKKKQSKFKR